MNYFISLLYESWKRPWESLFLCFVGRKWSWGGKKASCHSLKKHDRRGDISRKKKATCLEYEIFILRIPIYKLLVQAYIVFLPSLYCNDRIIMRKAKSTLDVVRFLPESEFELKLGGLFLIFLILLMYFFPFLFLRSKNVVAI